MLFKNIKTPTQQSYETLPYIKGITAYQDLQTARYNGNVKTITNITKTIPFAETQSWTL